jgi:ABC-type phosphate transport system substrate-binding protein
LLMGRLFSVALLLSASIPFASAKDIAVVSNKSTQLQSITMAELIKVCKAETTRWPDGKLVTFVMREAGSGDMKVVLEKIYGMSPEAVNSLIANVNHGHVNRPAIVVVNSDDAVIKKVGSTPGAIGLLDVYSITSAVSVVKLGGKLPLEPGYPLHGN